MSNYYILTNLLSDDERRVITSIVRHIELGGNKVGIQHPGTFSRAERRLN